MKTKRILSILNVLSWIAFIGLCIQAGTFLFSSIFTFFIQGEKTSRVVILENNFTALFIHNKIYYICAISLMVIFNASKAYLFYLVIEILKKINLEHPFSKEVSNLILKISYAAFQIWIVWIIVDQYIEWLLNEGFDIASAKNNLDSADGFIFLAGITFIIAQVFKRGVELQSENDLTI